MVTLVLTLTVAGFTEYTILHVEDLATCDRWGQLSLDNGEASAYSCLALNVAEVRVPQSKSVAAPSI